MQTPALDLIDVELVAIRDGLAMMFRRRAHFAAMMAAGMGDTDAVQAAQDEIPHAGSDRLTISMPPQEGKLIADDECVPTPDGWRCHGDLAEGDRVYHPSGRAIAVTWVGSEAMASMRVNTTDGGSVVVHPEHEWTVFDRAGAGWRTVTTAYLASRTLRSGPDGRGGRFVMQLPSRGVLKGTMRELGKLAGYAEPRRVAIASVEEVEPRPGRCIQVDSDDGLYLVGRHLTPTHNSSRVGRYGVLWWMRQFPGLHVGLVSYDGDHANRISYMVRGDIEVFNGEGGNPDLGLRLAKNQRAIGRWLLAPPHGGDVYAIGVGGGITGRPVDLLLIDDPVKDIRAADSLLLSSQAWDWWQTAARPRLAPWAPVIVVATRWHEADLIGRMLAKQQEDESAGLEHFDRWREVNVPAQADSETDVLGRQLGEFMASARGRTREQWEATKAATAPRFWTALYQGKPSPDVGDVWMREWWRRYDTPLWTQQPDGTYKLPGMDTAILSVDCAFRDKKSSDYVVIQCWAMKGADSYLISQVWARLSFTATLDALKRVARLFPDAHRKLIEAKANGDAVIDSLKHEMSGVIASEPTQSKVARAEAVSPFIRAGNVHLPSQHVASMQRDIAWDPDGLIVEATGFPNATHDDQVDATSQALAELYLGKGGPGSMHVAKGRIPGMRAPHGMSDGRFGRGGRF